MNNRGKIVLFVFLFTFLFAFINPIQQVHATQDEIGSTANTGGATINPMRGFPITASASGTLTTIGIYLNAGTTGNLRVGIYSTYSANTFSGLLGQSASTPAAAGWNDLSVTGVTITASATYFLVVESDTSGLQSYYAASGTFYYCAYTFGAFSDPTPTLTSNTGVTHNMRIVYISITATSTTTTTTSTTGTVTTTTTTTSAGITTTSTTTTTTSTTGTATTTTSTTGALSTSRTVPTTYTSFWTSTTQTGQQAGTSPYVFRGDTIQYGLGQSKGGIGQRHISGLGDTRVFLSVENVTGDLAVNVWSYSQPSRNGGVFISGLATYEQGYVVSDLISSGGYLWCVVAYQSITHYGISMSVIRITPIVYPATAYVVTNVGTYSTGYTTTSAIVSLIADCQLYWLPTYATSLCDVSYSYYNGATWDVEMVRLHNVGSAYAISIDAAVDVSLGWSVPIGAKFVADPVATRIYGIISPVYIQTYDASKGALLYEFTSTSAITHVASLNARPSSPATILYDAEKRMFLATYFSRYTPTNKVVVWTFICSTSVVTENSFNDPTGFFESTDCFDLVATGNGNGQFLIYGLWSSTPTISGYRATKYIYSTDFGVTWSSWIQAPSGTGLGLPRRLSMPTQMQQSGFIVGSQGYGSIMEYDDGWLFVRTFQYVPNVITFSGTLTIGGLTTQIQTSTVNQVSVQSMTGTKQYTVTTAQYITSDPTITTFSYSMLIILAFVGSAVMLSRTVFGMLFGSMLGVTIAAAMALIPIWLLIVVVVALVLVLIFARQNNSGGETS
jgi:hypothetical protein